jgi:hypothetical protein
MINTETEDFVSNSIQKIKQGTNLAALEENYTTFLRITMQNVF